MTNQPILNAVSSSARQLLTLLRCLPSDSKAHVRLSPEGLRVSTEEGSALEAFVFVEKALFTSYLYNTHANSTDSADVAGNDHPSFQINLNALLETLNIFTLSDLSIPKQPATTEAYAAHRLNRHAGINAFSSTALGMNGICTLTYASEGSPLSINMSDAGVTTTCDLTTYSATVTEEIPFSRESLSLKTIMRSTCLLDAVSELSAFNPAHLTISAQSTDRRKPALVLSAVGALGSASVDFTTDTTSDTPLLETFHCPRKTTVSFRFALIKSAQRAMAVASKVSLRLDDEGVLSLQFLVEMEGNTSGQDVSFVDFKVVPLVDGEAEGADGTDADSE